VYIVTNEGNITIKDIVVTNLIPKINDYTLNGDNSTNLFRNSEFAINALASQSFLTQQNVGFHDQIQDLSNFQGSNNLYQKPFVQFNLPGIIYPGQTKELVFRVKIPSNEDIGKRVFNNFYFYGYDASVTNNAIAIEGNSETKEILISAENNCPKLASCDESYPLEDQVQNAFTVTTIQNQVTINAQGLSPNDRWFPIWEPMINGGSGYHWGNGTYQTSHNYPAGKFNVCMKVENMTTQTNSQENICNCAMICKEINIE